MEANIFLFCYSKISRVHNSEEVSLLTYVGVGVLPDGASVDLRRADLVGDPGQHALDSRAFNKQHLENNP